MIVRCGVGDGVGKVCGRRVRGVRWIDPYGDPKRRFIVGGCTEHGFVALTRSQVDRAWSAGQETLHLSRAGETVILHEMFAYEMHLARRSADT